MPLALMDCTTEDMTTLVTTEDGVTQLTTEGLPDVTGVKLSGDVVMESLLAALVYQGLIIDSTT